MPSAAAIRSAATVPGVGAWGIAARIAAGSIASTADLDHRNAEASGAGTTPACRAQRSTATGRVSRPPFPVRAAGKVLRAGRRSPARARPGRPLRCRPTVPAGMAS
ncbi:hypothetical protein GCM10027168_11800 [Streptomyces capparidis]